MRLPPLPPRTTFAFGMSAGFEDTPVTVRLDAAVSASLTVNDIAPEAESSLIVRLLNAEMAGGWLGGAATVTVNVCVAPGGTPFSVVTVTANDPATAGVHWMIPEAASIDIPAGAVTRE